MRTRKAVANGLSGDVSHSKPPWTDCDLVLMCVCRSLWVSRNVGGGKRWPFGRVFRTSCPPDAEWVAFPWDPGWFACEVMSLKLALAWSPPCSWGNIRVCTEAVLLGQADAHVPRYCPVIGYSNCAWTLLPRLAASLTFPCKSSAFSQPESCSHGRKGSIFKASWALLWPPLLTQHTAP